MENKQLHLSSLLLNSISMKQKRFVSYYSHTQIISFTKDGVLIPLYLSKRLNMPSTFFYGYNIGEPPMPKEHRGMKFVQLHSKAPTPLQQFIDMLCHIILPARSIGGVFMIHKSRQVMLTTILYKLINPKGKVMVMGDIPSDAAEEITKNEFVNSKSCWLRQKINKYFRNLFFKKCDVFSVESQAIYERCLPIFKKYNWKCLVHCYPGIDDELFHDLNLKEQDYNQKENIILYVGRIGNHQKNTDMILQAAQKVDLKDWKIVLVGPITTNFITKGSSKYTEIINTFYQENPHLKEKIIFTGPIYDSKTLFEFYAKSKIFLLTSRYEGFANALSQAAALGCYIVSTDVGGASIVSNNWRFGCKLPQEDTTYLAKILTNIVNNKQPIDFTKRLTFDDLSYSCMIKNKVLPKMM